MIYLHGLGHFHPNNIIDNKFLEDLDIGTSDAWISERVGIQTRRTVLPLDYIKSTKNADTRAAIEAAEYSNATSGKRAAEMALQHAGISADQIGLVIAGGCSPDTVTPAEACVIAAELGMEATAFDLNSACSSFGAHMQFIANMRPETLPYFVLLISPENNTRTIDYNDRNTAVLWGDGTSAAVISVKHKSRAKVTFNSITSSPAGWNKVVIPRLGHFYQEGPTVQTFAIKRTIKLYRDIAGQEKYLNQQPYFIGHQANLVMLNSVCARCEIADDRHLYNVDEYGNTGAAGAPIVLSQHWGKFEAGDFIVLAVVGAGLTWSGMAIEFGE